MKNLLKVLGLVLVLGLFIISCSSNDTMPVKLTLEDSIKEIILSKGENYNFLQDSIYIEYMEHLGMELANNGNYAIGNLDEDNIPELAIFNDKDCDNVDDEGSLEIYSFNGTKYTLLDKVNMGFDNSNYEMKIGKISENQRGLLLNNNIGTHSGLTYGFILKDGKLKSILDDKKAPLISIYTENQIKDINNDGILEFSVVAIDPETEDITLEGSDKMTLWYKWNRRDSVTLVDVERKDYSKEASNQEILSRAKALIDHDFVYALSFLKANKDELSRYDNSILLQSYIEKLRESSSQRGTKINNLLSETEEEQNPSSVSKSISDNIDNLNSKEYLNREKVLKHHEDIKTHLQNNINLGFKLNVKEGIYYYSVNYEKFIDLFSDNILNEYTDYLQILAFNSNEPFMDDGGLMISQEQLIERILVIESFKILYPYSQFLPEIHEIYTNYINIYFFGDLHNPNFNHDTKIVKEETLEKFKNDIKNYEFTSFSYVTRDFLDWLKENNSVIDDKIREKLHNRIN